MSKNLKVVLLILVSLFIVVVIFVSFGYKVVDNFVHMGQRAKRAEAPAVLGKIQKAQIDYYGLNDRYLPLDVSSGQSQQVSGSVPLSEHPDWVLLGVTLEQRLHCEYKVRPFGADNSDFVASARCDLDNDGEYAVYEATARTEVRRVTEGNVY